MIRCLVIQNQTRTRSRVRARLIYNPSFRATPTRFASGIRLIGIFFKRDRGGGGQASNKEKLASKPIRENDDIKSIAGRRAHGSTQ